MSLIAIVGIWMLIGLVVAVLLGVVAFGIYKDKVLGTEANDFELIAIYIEEVEDIPVLTNLVKRIMYYDSTVLTVIGLILSSIVECALWPFTTVQKWSTFKRAVRIYRSRHGKIELYREED